MAERSASFLAADLGASSGRVMLGRVGPDELALTELHRFRNGPVELPDGLHWDILGLYLDVVEGLRRGAKADAEIRSIGIDSWAVDYGLLDGRGALIGNPFHYRDDRTAPAVAEVHGLMPAELLYSITGIQHLPFNTIYQLVADRQLTQRADRALLIPDLIGYWLTGQQVCEQTNASTTGMLDMHTADWSGPVLEAVGIRRDLLPEIVPPGHVAGSLTPAIRARTGLPASTTVTSVGSHDTASAVAGVPASEPGFGYISCGTWGLVGVELERPVVTEASRAANFTNERGIDGTIRYLRNVMGLWLMQETLRTWRPAGRSLDLGDLVEAAGDLPAGGPTFDPDDPRFLPPGDMPARIRDACAAQGVRPPGSEPEVIRCILDSLAAAFARAVHDAADLSGHGIDVIHIVGGGTQNALLCQLTADASGLPVLAGPIEATALGNILTQARAAGVLDGDRWAARDLIRRTHAVTRYEPRLSARAPARAATWRVGARADG
jgi:rhamnulokinase